MKTNKRTITLMLLLIIGLSGVSAQSKKKQKEQREQAVKEQIVSEKYKISVSTAILAVVRPSTYLHLIHWR